MVAVTVAVDDISLRSFRRLRSLVRFLSTSFSFVCWVLLCFFYYPPLPLVCCAVCVSVSVWPSSSWLSLPRQHLVLCTCPVWFCWFVVSSSAVLCARTICCDLFRLKLTALLRNRVPVSSTTPLLPSSLYFPTSRGGVCMCCPLRVVTALSASHFCSFCLNYLFVCCCCRRHCCFWVLLPRRALLGFNVGKASRQIHHVTVRVHLPRWFRIFKNSCAFALAAFRTSCHSLLLTFPFHQLSLPRSFQPWCRFCFGFDSQLGRPVVLTGFASSHTFQSLASEAESPFSMTR